MPRRRVLRAAGLAAASVAGLSFASRFLGSHAPRIETAVGEIRRVPLDDGSLAAVNTASGLAVALKPTRREVTLDRGEAWFQVAKDPDRPFVVAAGDVRVQAIGTAFAVRRTEDGAEVRVTEGVVSVWRVGAEAEARSVNAGSELTVRAAPLSDPVVAPGDTMDRALAWRGGQLMFNGESVAEAAAQFNRYNRLHIVVEDGRLGSQTMIGRFRTNEPEAFAGAVATLTGAKVTRDGDLIRLTRD